MELIKNFNQTLKDLKEKSRKDITGLLPDELRIFDLHFIEKNEIIRTSHLDMVRFEHQFRQSYSAVFGLSGEMEGFAVCQAHTAIPKDLFVESMNILVGNFLTNLDEKEQILSTLLAPIIFHAQAENTKQEDDHFYKFSHRLRLFMQEAQTFHAKYTLFDQTSSYPITITFIVKFKGPEYDWQHI
ncbi:MAG: hypothetical protein ACOYL6_05300 [Bacteriovoracaceae bacterium]